MRTPLNYSGAYDATSLITHITGASMTIAVCVSITPTIGSAVGITSHTANITGLTGYGGITFKTTTGVAASKMEENAGAAASNLETDTILSAAGITEAEILSGKWNHAQVDLFILNYEAPTMGQLLLKRGFYGNFSQMGAMLRGEIRDFNQSLTNNIGRLTRPSCDADFCDARCGLNPATYTVTGTLTAVTSQLVFRDSSRTEADNAFHNGKITWTGGNNNGFAQEIDSWTLSTKEFVLRKPTPYLPVIGDTYSAIIGCGKDFEVDCVTRFSNAVNFRGFPHVNPPESILKLPDN